MPVTSYPHFGSTVTFEFKLPAASATHQDRQDYALELNGAARVTHPGVHSSVAGTRLILHCPEASHENGDLLFSEEPFVESLRTTGFTKFVYTNDADKTFEWDVSPPPTQTSAGTSLESLKQTITANSEATKSSPAAAASLARVGRLYTPQELADLVQKGQASKLAVVTDPPEAEIDVDGNKGGISPLVIMLLKYEDTPRVITIKMNGYKAVEKSVVPAGKVIPIGLTLEKESRQ